MKKSANWFQKRAFLPLGFLILTVLLSSSCRTTRYVTFNSSRPAEITFAPEIQNFVIVDRTEFENKNVNIIEGVLTGERPGDDKRGVLEMMMNFRQQMENTGRFQVKVSEERLKGNQVLGELPSPESWETIIRIANENQADLVVMVEVFDSDFRVMDSRETIMRKIAEGAITKTIPVIEFYSKGDGRLTSGFRIYDPLNKEIIDQELFDVNHHWESKGLTPIAASNALIHRGEAMRILSSMAGRRYASKLAPTPIRIRREFWARRKGAPEIAIGTRYADVNEWNKSIETWQRGLDTSSKRKARGGYCHNIAVAYEVLGDFEKALEWSSRAWVEYKDKKSKYYHRALRNRIRDEQILNDQL